MPTKVAFVLGGADTLYSDLAAAYDGTAVPDKTEFFQNRCNRINASNVRLCGIPDRYISQASRQAQLQEVGLDADSLTQIILDMLPIQTKLAPAKK